MSEIEKMYKNAGVKKIELDYPDNFEPFYPEFTTKKQIELIKLLAKGEIKIDNTDGEYEFSILDTVSDFDSFEESLADLTNRIWQDLTEEERKQIRNILESEVRE